MNPAGALHGLSRPQSHRDVVPGPSPAPGRFEAAQGGSGPVAGRCGPAEWSPAEVDPAEWTPAAWKGRRWSERPERMEVHNSFGEVTAVLSVEPSRVRGYVLRPGDPS